MMVAITLERDAGDGKRTLGVYVIRKYERDGGRVPQVPEEALLGQPLGQPVPSTGTNPVCPARCRNHRPEFRAPRVISSPVGREHLTDPSEHAADPAGTRRIVLGWLAVQIVTRPARRDKKHLHTFSAITRTGKTEGVWRCHELFIGM
jgi:hypothetical protein